jgi:hypothetical protein
LEVDLKSNVSTYLGVAVAVYHDAAAKCVANVSDLRDLETIKSRVEHEGLSFLTITLPSFASDFEQSLANGGIGPSHFRSFRKCGAIPAFLQGMLGQIFDRETGSINDKNTQNLDFTTIVESVRQICCTFKKVKMACTPERDQAAVENFVAIEKSFSAFELPREEIARFSSVSSVLWDNLISSLSIDMCLPRHGPGATAEGIHGNSKYTWQYWYDRLEPYFPIIDNGYSISAVDSVEFDLLTIVPEQDELPVKVTLVPKTLKGPRVIAIEPCCMQYIQQGIRGVLYDAIESYWYTSGHVNFRDQSINQSLAINASIDGQLATVDLSEASDRVPLDLALIMFDSNPDFRDAIRACRSTKALLPDGTVIGPLRKFASMGSALCFPIEAMYFYTLCVDALLRIRELPVTPRNVYSVTRSVYVYGDDIIIPSTYATVVLDHMQKYNCKVNTSKTFWTGKFRESCGVEAYDGYVVTPVYLRAQPPENMHHSSELLSWSASANLFYKKGYWRTAQFLHSHVEKIVRYYPYVSEDSPAMGRISFLGYRSAERWNDQYQSFEVKGWVPTPVYRTDELEGYGALQKSLLSLESSDSSKRAENSFEQSALHGAVTLKRRWVPTQIVGLRD